MKQNLFYTLLLLAVALLAGSLAFALGRWYAAAPAPTAPVELQEGPIAFSRLSDDGSAAYIILRDGTEVYRINAEMLGAPQTIGNVVRIRFSMYGSENRTQYTADLLVPEEGFPIELFSPVSGEESGEEVVDARGLVAAIADRSVIELRIVLDPTNLATPEEAAQLAALRGIFSGQEPPANTPFRPLGVGYVQQ